LTLPGRYATVRLQIWQRVTGRWVTVAGKRRELDLLIASMMPVGRRGLPGGTCGERGEDIRIGRRLNATPLRPGLIPAPACPVMKNAGNPGADVVGEKARAGGHVPLTSYP